MKPLQCFVVALLYSQKQDRRSSPYIQRNVRKSRSALKAWTFGAFAIVAASNRQAPLNTEAGT